MEKFWVCAPVGLWEVSGMTPLRIRNVFAGVTATLHLGFFFLEAFLWTTPTGLRIFRLDLAQAQASATLAANQGFYNLMIALALFVALFLDEQRRSILLVFFLTFVVLVGVFGAATVSPRILLLQALPASLGLLAHAWSRRPTDTATH